MPMTLGDIITATREILQDTVMPYRYPNVGLYRIVNQAISEARRLRPDLFLEYLWTDLPVFTPDDKDLHFPVFEGYQVAFVNFIAGRAELRDDQFENNQRAASLLSSFKAQLSTALA